MLDFLQALELLAMLGFSVLSDRSNLLGPDAIDQAPVIDGEFLGQQNLGERLQLSSGVVAALTEQTEASTSGDPPGTFRSYMVLELQEALFPAPEKEVKDTEESARLDAHILCSLNVSMNVLPIEDLGFSQRLL